MNTQTNCFVCKRKRNEIEDGGTETLMLTGYQRPSPYSDCTDEGGDDDDYDNNVYDKKGNDDHADYGGVYSDWVKGIILLILQALIFVCDLKVIRVLV